MFKSNHLRSRKILHFIFLRRHSVLVEYFGCSDCVLYCTGMIWATKAGPNQLCNFVNLMNYKTKSFVSMFDSQTAPSSQTAQRSVLINFIQGCHTSAPVVTWCGRTLDLGSPQDLDLKTRLMLRMPMLFINIDYINVPSILHNVFITKPGAGTPRLRVPWWSR